MSYDFVGFGSLCVYAVRQRACVFLFAWSRKTDPRSPAEHAPRLQVDLETQGFQCLAADVGCEGVLYHPKHTLPAVEKYLHGAKM